MAQFFIEKKPAFFPFAAAEVFFESESMPDFAAVNTAGLDAELDSILGVS
jgi:hypothetical protein